MRAVEIRLVRDLVCELARRRSRLISIDVKPCANPALAHRVQQRRLIHDLAARSVDEVRARAHSVEEIRAEKGARFRLQGDVYAHDVRRARNIKRTVGALNTQLFRALRREAATPSDYGQAE